MSDDQADSVSACAGSAGGVCGPVSMTCSRMWRSGVGTVTTVRADERIYYPVHAVPYTPARYFAKGKNDPEFRTKLVIGAELAIRARAAGFTFRAVAADSAYGDQDGFRAGLAEA